MKTDISIVSFLQKLIIGNTKAFILGKEVNLGPISGGSEMKVVDVCYPTMLATSRGTEDFVMSGPCDWVYIEIIRQIQIGSMGYPDVDKVSDSSWRFSGGPYMWTSWDGFYPIRGYVYHNNTTYNFNVMSLRFSSDQKTVHITNGKTPEWFMMIGYKE